MYRKPAMRRPGCGPPSRLFFFVGGMSCGDVIVGSNPFCFALCSIRDLCSIVRTAETVLSRLRVARTRLLLEQN